MTILPTAMRIQDDIPKVLGERVKEWRTLNKAEIRERDLRAVEGLREVSEKPPEAPAKLDADGWIPWGGGECPIKCDAGRWMYKLGRLDGVDRLGSDPSDGWVYSAMWAHDGRTADLHQITAYKVL